MFISKVFSFFFACVLAGCGNSVSQPENTNQPQLKEKMELSLKMERSHCYGTCPVYELTLQPDGKVLFNGIDFTEIKGKVKGNLSEEKMSLLVDEIKKADFFSLDNAYNSDSSNCPNFATDSPDVTLYIKLNEKEKTVNHYLGCFEDDKPNEASSVNKPQDLSKIIYPQDLYNLENKIDEIVETKRWIGERKY